MINIGCHYGPDDLSPDTWDQLLVLNLERAFVDRLVNQRRDKAREEESEVNKARSQAGVPPPGGTLFPTSRPFK